MSPSYNNSKPTKKVYKLISLIIIIALGIGIFFAVKGIINMLNSNNEPKEVILSTPSPVAATNTPPPTFTIAPTLASKSSIEDEIRSIISKEKGVYSIAYLNMKSKEKFLINSDKMPSASIIKLYIMMEAYNQIKAGLLSEEKVISLKKNMKVAGAGSLSGKPDGSKISISELIRLMITESDNTATNILIDILKVENINGTIKKLGCTDTILQRKMMDTESIKAGKDNFTSVKDLCLALEKLYKGEWQGKEIDTKMIEILKGQKNRTKIPKPLPSGISIANKTGELDNIENDAAIVFTSNGDYILCVLSNKISGSENAKKIISQISKSIFDYTNK